MESDWMQDWGVLHSKLAPPRLRPPVLPRPRLYARLEEGLRARGVLIQAGAGYGKSTLIVAFLQQRPERSAWYACDESDADPFHFCAHLAASVDRLAPGTGAAVASLMEQCRLGETPWALVIDALSNHLFANLEGPVWFVCDDLHAMGDQRATSALLLDRFLAHAPEHLHFLLSSRHWPDLPGLSQTRAHSQMILLGEQELALTATEIADLYRRYYAIPLNEEQIQRLSTETEGWVIALQLLAHQLRGREHEQIQAMLADLPWHLNALFDYLTNSIIDRQPPSLQAFLYQTAILRELTPATCDAVRRTQDSSILLEQLHESGLSLAQIDQDVYRHHPLVREFLERNLFRDRPTWRTLHRRAAAYFAQSDDAETSIHHLIQAGDHEAAAHQISALATSLIQTGRFTVLAHWLDQLPETLLNDQPDLRIVQGDVYRLTSQYDAAIKAYQMAEASYAAQGDMLGRSRALECQALVYIDTVRPMPAEALVKQALRVIARRHPPESARLLRLLAENAVNHGRPRLASRWYQASQRLNATPDLLLEARILLRSGRLSEARALLAPVTSSSAQLRPARTHREPSLLLAFIDVLLGDTEKARASATWGLELARKLASPFTEAVAHMRLGHAWRMGPYANGERAREHYERAIALMRQIEVRRGEAEPQFGLALLHAHAGNSQQAQQAGTRSLEIAQRAGDDWVMGLARLSLGINAILRNDVGSAYALLDQTLTELEACEDRFGITLVHLWLTLLALRHEHPDRFVRHADAFLANLDAYPFLLQKPTLFGPSDPQTLIPVLIRARDMGIRSEQAANALASLGLSPARQYHPGYTLRVQTLGRFQVWRGRALIGEQEWRRKTARRLFQHLLIHRNHFLQREQIIEALWPEVAPGPAENLFKVALNALHKTLEPNRPRKAAPFFILRRDTSYGLNPVAAIDVDVDAYQHLVQSADERWSGAPAEAEDLYRRALELYQGVFLPDAIYEDWTDELRQQLQRQFLLSAERLARLELGVNPAETLHWCERILAVDACWEPAYRLSMRAYAALGQRHLLAYTYQSCIDTLRKELDLAPMPETTNLYHNLVHGITPEVS